MRGFSTRVRYAPSPTGFVHLGGLRTALFNFLHARKTGGEFFVRFEDTDRTRLVPGSDDDILKVLAWAGITLDGGKPEYQSARLPVYEEHANLLLDKGAAYRCFCSKERLEGLRGSGMYPRLCLHLPEEEQRALLRDQQSFTIRMKVPEGGPTVVNDLIRGLVSFDHRQVDDQVLMKSDGFPTYHLASVVDDHLMGVTDVIRGEEWLPSTAKHLMLYSAFGWQPPRFAHLPLLLSDQGGKLSKRHADASVKSFIEAGYQPEAMVNFVAFLGWAPDGNDYDEVMSLNELVSRFSLQRVHKGGAAVSRRKLDFFNSKHIERLLASPEGRALLRARFLPFVSHMTQDADYALQVLEKIHTRLSPMAEVASKCSYFFRDPDFSTEEALAFRAKAWREPESAEALRLLEPGLAALPQWTAHAISECVASLKSPLSKSQVMQALRYKLTGTMVGAGVPETMELLGREVVLKRLKR